MSILKENGGVKMFPEWVSEFGTIILQAFFITAGAWAGIIAYQDVKGMKKERDK